MKAYNLCLFIIISFLLISCNGQQYSNYKYSKKETEQFLDDIVKNAKISIGDITEIKKEQTDELYLFTRYPISETEIEEFDKNNGTITNKDDDISDFTTYSFKDYELITENNEKLQFVDNGRAVYLQEYAIWEYNNVLYRNLGFEIKLNKKYEKLKGHITIEFEMPRNVKREIKIAVNTTIYDKLPE
ncbi:hypothetical protein [Maribacter sp. Asnod1-A12]|uniref:hypothetical protein n=1 Tax=Maribacter sp. Asnod1-A12 TaxID=3160576 RepID=UPI00386C2E57